MASEDVVANLKQLIRNRGTIKRKLTRFEQFVNKIATADSCKPSLSDVEARYKYNINLLEEFESVQSIIESLCEEIDLDSHYKEHDDFQERYFTSQDLIKKYIAQESRLVLVDKSLESAANSSNTSGIESLQNLLLPKIKLGSFNGNFENWMSFKLNFSSIICSNNSLQDFQKYHFLKASVEGYASRLIEGLENVHKPFEQAWHILCDRFDKKQFLLDTHFKQLLGLQSVNKEGFHQFNYMLDQITKNITAIEGLNLDSEVLYDYILIHILSDKLDKTTLREWKELKYDANIPTFKEFIEFLKNKADLLQSLEQCSSTRNSYSQNFKDNKQAAKPAQYSCSLTVDNTNSYVIKCNFCKKDHTIYQCSHFLALSVEDRINKVKALNLCQNCLRTGHSSVNCTLSPCKICKKNNRVLKHNTLLHRGSKNTQEHKPTSTNSSSEENALSPSLNVLGSANHGLYQGQGILSTIKCNIQDTKGDFHSCRALLDSGSQSNLITENLCKKLNIPLINTNLSIIGINQVVSQLTKKCNVTIFSTFSDYKCNLSCFLVPIITSNMPAYSFSTTSWKIPNKVNLADPSFEISQDIDILIGASIFWELILEDKIRLGIGLPVLQNTHFGYVITGTASNILNSYSCKFSKIHIPEDDQLKKFWELEEIPSPTILSQGDLACEKLFEKETSVNEEGQYVVKFPLKHSPNLLGNTKDIAIKRFQYLEKKFSDANFHKLYSEFMKEYETLGHMTKLSEHISNDPSTITCFIPHHGILKENNITTKLRTVFDASCPSSTGWSLNDLQYTGPKVQNDIINIILRFRLYTYVVSADVSMMYRQILMHPDHRPLQQIVWREKPNTEFSIYQLNTITYGTSSAPYLAIKCLKQVAVENLKQFPEACQTILNDFYVDDLLTGSDNLQELKKRCKQVYSILQSRHFILRKWNSNNYGIISDFESSKISNSVLNLGKEESSKTLGLQWVTYSDTLKYNIKQFFPVTITKRYILSTIAQIYDPLGLLSPSVIISKIIIQKLWSLRVSWDSSVPSDLEKTFLQFREGLVFLNNITIPRNVISVGYKLADIHCYCDASKDAYAAAVYLRSEYQSSFNVKLLCAKSKVAPLKTISIPKLELCAILLGTELIELVERSLSTRVPIFMWSDSQIALSWIRTEPSCLQVFVANRVAKIQSMSENHTWRYVNTKENPADLASRGVTPEKLLLSDLWWTGPSFLRKSSAEWPNGDYIIHQNQLPELKHKTKVLQLTNQTNSEFFSKYSNLNKLIRVIAQCLRYLRNIKNKTNKQTGPLTVSELENANNVLIRLAQKESFGIELSILKKNLNLGVKHKLSTLTPFIDNNGILRVGGRLKYTYLSYNLKHPILLSSKHLFTKLIFEHKHKQLLHPGPQLLLSSVRQFYWTIGGLNLAKKITKNCMTCFKFNPTLSQCPMSSLPDNRIKPSLPFQVTGIDYAGPFSILSKPGRGAKVIKCYLAVFVCFCTKSVHLEVVLNLTTESFLTSLKRFISRRGLPSVIYSDNGSTFVGANNELKSLGHFLHNNKDSIVDCTSQDRIRWVFIPPYSPNFGGLWEAAVKSSKHFLKRALYNCNVTYEEFNTLVIQVEGILNSRPLFAMSNDPNDLNPITPSHFLIGRNLKSLPETSFEDINVNRLTRLQHIQKLYQQIWSQFSKQYVSQLHQQYKWKELPTKLEVGTLVLIKSDIQSPCMWPLGRIIRILPSKDGVSRVAEIFTSKGSTVRSIRHLSPLPCQEETDN